MSRALAASFRSLAVPNYRRYFTGQIVSLSGNWMQVVAEMWLVVKLTDSGAAVGFAAALQFLPMLLGAAWGGLLADRLPKRRLLMATQAAMAVPALVLFALALGGQPPLAGVLGLILARGAINAIDHPTRQAFIVEMVGPDRLLNAVSLNAALVNSARVIGPAIAGVLIATAGIAPCFAINAATFLFMIAMLAAMERSALRASEPASRSRGQLRRALRHVRGTPQLLIPLALMALVGTLAFNFQVVLPLLARFTFHDQHGGIYAALTTAMGLGAVAGALVMGARGRPRPAFTTTAALAFGVAMALTAAAPSLGLALAALVLTGAASVAFAASVNSSLQLSARPRMRGRIMALYAMVFLGSTPIGGPLSGWLAGWAGPRSALALGAVAAIAGGLLARVAYRRAGVSLDSPAGPLGDAAPRAPEPAAAPALHNRLMRPRYPRRRADDGHRTERAERPAPATATARQGSRAPRDRPGLARRGR